MNNEPIIHITEEELYSTPPTVEINEKELEENHAKVRISEPVYNEICDRTKQYSQENKGEFWLFLIGRHDVAENTVEVGRGYQSGVTASSEEVVATLRPWVEQGYRVVADYHNHPPESVLDYRANNRPGEQAISPSLSDILSDISLGVVQQLGQNPYPRIIGAISEDRGMVMSGFQIMRNPSLEEVKTTEVEEPIRIIKGADENGITVLPSFYTDPVKLINLGIVKAVDIAIQIPQGEITMPSPF